MNEQEGKIDTGVTRKKWHTSFTCVTPFSKYLALALFVALPFAGFWLGVEYEKKYYVPRLLLVTQKDTAKKIVVEQPMVAVQDDAFQTKQILDVYLSPYVYTGVEYSGLSVDEISDINKVLSIARLSASHTEEQKMFADSTYQHLFVDTVLDRVEDAPSMRANNIIKQKLCVAMALILEEQRDVVSKCSPTDSFPEPVVWLTDDITAEAQVSPYYVAGSYYFEDAEDGDRSEYYLLQVVRHHEAGVEQWGKDYFENVAGDVYLNMVEDAQKKLQTLMSL